jgi:hypothetical protein
VKPDDTAINIRRHFENLGGAAAGHEIYSEDAVADFGHTGESSGRPSGNRGGPARLSRSSCQLRGAPRDLHGGPQRARDDAALRERNRIAPPVCWIYARTRSLASAAISLTPLSHRPTELSGPASSLHRSRGPAQASPHSRMGERTTFVVVAFTDTNRCDPKRRGRRPTVGTRLGRHERTAPG